MRNKWLFIVFLLPVFALAQPYYSPFNPGVIEIDEETAEYSFLVSGHFYGSSASSQSGLPASTLLAGLDIINASGSDFMLSTGDMFIDAHAEMERYQTAFFNKLKMPLVNAVGNHDIESEAYLENFGPADLVIELGQDRLIVLDAERNDSRLDEEQIDLLTTAFEASQVGGLRNLFILTHRPIWAEGIDRYDGLFKNNTQSLTGTNFQSDVLPVLESIAENSQVYWFSGSMGGGAPASVFVDNYDKGIHFIQSAIRDRKKDAVLKVTVNRAGVRFTALSLAGDLMPQVSELDLDFWRKNVGQSTFKWKLVPYYIKRCTTHRYFLYGLLSMFVLLVLGRLVFRRLA